MPSHEHIGQRAVSAHATELQARALELERKAARMEARSRELVFKVREAPPWGWAPPRGRDIDELTERAGLMLIVPSPIAL